MIIDISYLFFNIKRYKRKIIVIIHFTYHKKQL